MLLLEYFTPTAKNPKGRGVARLLIKIQELNLNYGCNLSVAPSIHLAIGDVWNGPAK